MCINSARVVLGIKHTGKGPGQTPTVDPRDDGPCEVGCRDRVGVGLDVDGLKDVVVGGADAVVCVVVGEGVESSDGGVCCQALNFIQDFHFKKRVVVSLSR